MRLRLTIALAAVLAAVLGLTICGWPRQRLGVTVPDQADPSPAQYAREVVRQLSRPRNEAVSEQPHHEYRRTTNFLALLASGEFPNLTAEQVEQFLQQNHRTAQSLIVASRATGDRAFLREATEKYPDDPHVAFDAIFRGEGDQDRRQWLDRFKRSAPENSLPNYISALDYLKAGQTDAAVRELQTAQGKANFQDYSLDFLQDGEEAYRAAGYSEAEAKMAAVTQLLLPHLAPLKDLGNQLIGLAGSYRQAGDEASAEQTLQIAMNLGQQLAEPGAGNFLINNLVGLAMEKMIFNSLDPNSEYGSSGRTVKDYLEEIQQKRDAIKQLAREEERFLKTMSEQDIALYFERLKIFGGTEAIAWLKRREGQGL